MKAFDKRNGRSCLPVLIALTLALIWGHSLLGRELSSKESGFVTRLLTPVLELVVGRGNVTNLLVRKLAHFSEYTLLGTELCLYFTLKRQDGKSGFLLSTAHGLFSAFLDETIQIFSGRGPSVTDIWIDFSGVITGSLILLLILLSRKRRNKKGTFPPHH